MSDEITDILAYQGTAIWSDEFVLLLLRNDLTQQPPACLLAQTQPPLSSDRATESLALWLYDGLSTDALTATAIFSEVEGPRDKNLDAMRYDFTGGIGQYFLTRSQGL